MKSSIRFLIIISFVISLSMFLTACGGGGSSSSADFTTSDLSGTWYFHGASCGGTAEGTIRGTIVLNSSGQVTGGSYTHSNGAVASLTGGTITIDGSGVISGSITTDVGVDVSIASGKMDSSKNIISFVDSTNDDEFDFIIAIRSGGTFATSDLPGTWHFHGASSGGTAEGTIRGTIVLDSSGQVTGGSYTHSDGAVASLTGGTITIDGSGVISGSITTDVDVVVSITSGKMYFLKNIISFVDSMNDGEFDFIIAIKSGGTFATSDLPGTWYFHGASSGGTAEGTIRGTIVLNSSGQVTGGSYTHSDGAVVSLTGGTITIDGSGVISGSITTDTGVDVSITSGKMDSSKNVLSFVDSTNYDEFDLIFVVKGN